jgi:signal transduction histidine kinase
MLRLFRTALNAHGSALAQSGLVATSGEVPPAFQSELSSGTGSVEQPVGTDPLWKDRHDGLWDLSVEAGRPSATGAPPSRIHAFGRADRNIGALERLVIELLPILTEHQRSRRGLRNAMSSFASITQAAEDLCRRRTTLRDFLKRIAPVLDADYMLVTRTSPAGDELTPASGFGFTEVAPTFPLREESLQSWVYKHREPVYIPDAQVDSRFLLISEAALSEICAPIWSRGTAGGALSAASVTREAFNNHDLSLLRFFAVLVSLWLRDSQEASPGTAPLPARRDGGQGIRESVRRDVYATLRHELRAPLSVVKGRADLLLTGEFGELSKEQARSAESIVSSASALDRQIDRLLSFLEAELEPDRAEPSWGRPVDLLEEMRPRLEAMVSEAGMEIDFSISGEDLTARLDRGSLRIIISNLLDNSVRFASKGGHVEVSISTDGEEHWKLEVRDDGRGIPAAELPNVFDRFYSTADSDGREGTGLGLALVKRLAELSGGTVSVWSREGQGATFSVRFPVSRQ